MTKQFKRILKLCAKPAPKDFSWKYLVALTRSAGFKEFCDGGSHYTFQHESGYTFTLSKTHPSGILKEYQIKNAISALKYVGAIGESDDGSE